MASLAVRTPPATLTPTRRPVASAKSRTAASITSATGGVAAGDTLPVEVLMKSAPDSMASHDARATLSSVDSSPVSRITLRWAGPDASRTARISSPTCPNRPPQRRPRGDIVERGQLTGLQDHLEMGRTGCLADRADLLAYLPVPPGKERAAIDDHVHLVGAGGHRIRDVGQLDRQRGAARRERRGHGRHQDPAAC